MLFVTFSPIFCFAIAQFHDYIVGVGGNSDAWQGFWRGGQGSGEHWVTT